MRQLIAMKSLQINDVQSMFGKQARNPHCLAVRVRCSFALTVMHGVWRKDAVVAARELDSGSAIVRGLPTLTMVGRGRSP